jgi:hypothetical protein
VRFTKPGVQWVPYTPGQRFVEKPWPGDYVDDQLNYTKRSAIQDMPTPPPRRVEQWRRGTRVAGIVRALDHIEAELQHATQVPQTQTQAYASQIPVAVPVAAASSPSISAVAVPVAAVASPSISAVAVPMAVASPPTNIVYQVQQAQPVVHAAIVTTTTTTVPLHNIVAPFTASAQSGTPMIPVAQMAVTTPQIMVNSPLRMGAIIAEPTSGTRILPAAAATESGFIVAMASQPPKTTKIAANPLRQNDKNIQRKPETDAGSNPGVGSSKQKNAHAASQAAVKAGSSSMVVVTSSKAPKAAALMNANPNHDVKHAEQKAQADVKLTTVTTSDHAVSGDSERAGTDSIVASLVETLNNLLQKHSVKSKDGDKGSSTSAQTNTKTTTDIVKRVQNAQKPLSERARKELDWLDKRLFRNSPRAHAPSSGKELNWLEKGLFNDKKLQTTQTQAQTQAQTQTQTQSRSSQLVGHTTQEEPSLRTPGRKHYVPAYICI